MSVSRSGRKPCSLYVAGQGIEQVTRFKYLGQWVTEEWALREELRIRIEVARAAFNNMRRVLCSRDLSFALRWRMVRCYIFSIVLYGVESWTLKTADINRLEAFEMWLIRRMFKIPWTARLRNDYILQRNNLSRELMRTVKTRKVAYLGHILRNPKYELLQKIMMGKISGRRGVGRKRASWLLNIRQWTGIPRAADLFQMARDRDRFGEVIANLR
ncbi:Dehydrogenase [Nesidiocoris tenuis]|uniref:Dehydrogenase n=1 Tax=Nesidiocoris tenuis TaxID=355587 RepID=A0ABN7A586_9HEMI|nr:Dehydrogenase [Nesidiocoris tenuis]